MTGNALAKSAPLKELPKAPLQKLTLPMQMLLMKTNTVELNLAVCVKRH